MTKSSRVIYEPHPTQPGGLVPKKVIDTEDKKVTVKDVKSGTTKSYISSLVQRITAKSEAKCKIVKKNKFGSEITFENNAKCPDEETGKNSVAA